MIFSDIMVNSISSSNELVTEVRKLLRTNPINPLSKKVEIFGFEPPFVDFLIDFDFEEDSVYDWYSYFVYQATLGNFDYEYFYRIRILFDALLKKDNLDLLYYLGLVVCRSDEYCGLRILELAANNDCIPALLKLLNHYCYNSYDRSMVRALSYARSLAKLGYTIALFTIGYLTDIGYGGAKPNRDSAIKIMEEASEYGSEVAREWLLRNRNRNVD